MKPLEFKHSLVHGNVRDQGRDLAAVDEEEGVYIGVVGGTDPI